ncbi:MAG: DUF1015 domain-containing protein [Planctomycetota bacterium]
MANIQALRGLRYDLSKVGSLSDVIAPPYDVIKSGLQDELYNRSDFNFVRLILNRGDDLQEDETVYDAAAAVMKDWRRDEVLRPDSHEAVYVYHQSFEFEGQSFLRRGFMSRVKLEPFGTGRIYPHEETHSRAKEDRLNLTRAVQCNLSQIFGIYPDENNEAQEILEAAIEDRTPITAVDHLGVRHDMWLVTDLDAIARAAAVMGDKPVYVADGHHRYETACNYQREYREQNDIQGDHPVDYVLMMNISMHDPGMIVLPTHRLFRDVPPITSDEFITRVSVAFDCEKVGTGAEKTAEIWEEIAVEDEQSTMAFYCKADDTWVMNRLNEQGIAKMQEVAPDKSDDWRSLGVAILHELVIKNLLGLTELPSPLYVHAVDEVIEGINNGDAAGRDATGQMGSGAAFELAALVMPATTGHVKAISENGERMPAKSTYFYPKLLGGLVVNPLT